MDHGSSARKTMGFGNRLNKKKAKLKTNIREMIHKHFRRLRVVASSDDIVSYDNVNRCTDSHV